MELFVPGRLCLFGEHSDWAGALRASDPTIDPGACILTGTDQGIRAEVQASDGFEVASAVPGVESRQALRLPMEAEALRRAAASGGYFSYAAGVAAVMQQRYGCGGVSILETGCDLPAARGLSSSAAICVLTARAFNRAHRLGLGVRDEMEAAYLGELAAGSQCGRMDQACAYGDKLVELGFDGESMSVRLFQASSPLFLLIVDLLHAKDTRRILDDLHQSFARGGEIRAALGRQNLEIIDAARRVLESGDGRALGELMTAAQALFDRAVAPASAELRAPRLHALLADAATRELAWGGKGVGSQGDGAAQLVCRGPAERDELARRLTAAGLGTCLPLTVGPAAPAASDSRSGSAKD